MDGANELQKRIDKALQNDFTEEERFMGHITIARVKTVSNKEALLTYLDNYTIKPQRTEVSSFQLKQSVLTPSGPRYKTIQSFKII